MLISKYNYDKLERETIEGKRHYCLPDGSKTASVTTILDATKPQADREALDNWRKAVGERRANEVCTEAANRGTRMHSYMEHYVEHGFHKKRPGNPFAWASHAMAQVIIDKAMPNVTEAWGVEASLYYTGLYAGTTDLVGKWKGEPAIMDFKQTNKPKTIERVQDYFLQLVFYGTAHNKMFGTKIQTGAILMCVKPDEKDPASLPVYQEFILEGKAWHKKEEEMWNRVEQYYTNR